MPTSIPTKTINSISANLKAYKAEIRDKALESNIEELDSLLDTLKKQKDSNTVIGNFTKSMSKKVDNAFNPTTYLRAVMPKFMKTWHENLNEYDKRRKAIQQRDALLKRQHEKQVAEVRKEIDDLINSDDKLKAIFKQYGKEAATQAALRRKEQSAIDQAEKEYADNMQGIESRLESLSQDAELEWARRKGIQLIKITHDAPTLEELEKIRGELKEKIDADTEAYQQERIDKKVAASQDRFSKTALLERKAGLRRFFSKPGDDVKAGGGFLDSLFSGGISGFVAGILPSLIKGGLIALLAIGVEKYLKDEEFRDEVNKTVKKLLTTILDFMKEHWKGVLLALAVVFPFKTLRVIGALAMELYDMLSITAKRLRKIVLPDVDPMQQQPEVDDHAEREREKQKEKDKEKPKTNKEKAKERKEQKKEKKAAQARQRAEDRRTKAEKAQQNKPQSVPQQENKPQTPPPQQQNKPSTPKGPGVPKIEKTPGGKFGIRPGPTFWATLPLYMLWAAAEDARDAEIGDTSTTFGSIGTFGLWLSESKLGKLLSPDYEKRRKEASERLEKQASPTNVPVAIDDAITHYEKLLDSAKTPEERASIKTALDAVKAMKVNAPLPGKGEIRTPLDESKQNLGPIAKIKINKFTEGAMQQVMTKLVELGMRPA